MYKSHVHFARLRQLLLGLDFSETIVPESHVGFRHEPSDTTIMLPIYQANEVVASRHLVPVRTLLDAKGLLGIQEFDRALNSSPQKQSAS